MSAVRSLHIEEGYQYSLCQSLRLKRVLRALTINGAPPQQKLPITMDILQRMLGVLPVSYDGTVYWAAMTLAFYGCLRAAELCVLSKSKFDPDINLCLRDVQFLCHSNTDYLSVRVKRSKTDTENRGFCVSIGCADATACSHCSMHAMLAVRPTSGLPTTPDSPLFLLSSGAPLSKESFIAQTKASLLALGLDHKRYSGHSYRAGSATSAALAGFADFELQLLGRWSSSAYQQYIRAPTTLLIGYSARLAHQSAAPPQPQHLVPARLLGTEP